MPKKGGNSDQKKGRQSGRGSSRSLSPLAKKKAPDTQVAATPKPKQEDSRSTQERTATVPDKSQLVEDERKASPTQPRTEVTVTAGDTEGSSTNVVVPASVPKPNEDTVDEPDRSNVSNDDSTSGDASPPMQESSLLSTASLNTTTSPEVL